MKQLFPRISFGRLRLFSACVLVFLMLTAPMAPLATPTHVSWPSKTNATGQPTSQQTAREKLSAIPLVSPLGPLVPLGPNVTATLDDNFPLASKKNPGDTINYTAVINNTAGTDASGISYTDTLDNNTTLSGTVRVSPVTVNDSYACTGNLSISIAAPGVLGNDYLGQNPAGTITASDTTSANSGTVAVAADGSFTYEPPRGFTGADTFHYTLSNSTGSSQGTVTVTVSNMIWFIDNSSACASNCNGRFSHPYTSLANFIAAQGGGGTNPKAGDSIFIYKGNSPGTPYSGNLILLGTQRLIGQGDALNSTTLGFTPDANTNVTLPGATGKPTLTGTLTLATGVTALALDLSTGASTGISGTTGNGITVGDSSPTSTNGFTVTTTTGTAVSLSNLGGTFTFRSISANGATHGISLTTTTGSFDVEGDGASDPANTTRGRTTAKNGGGTLALGSGGTIQNCTSAGVLLSSATNVTLRNMTIQNNGSGIGTGGDGISATNGSALTLDNVLITGQAGNYGLHATGLSGATLEHSEIGNNATSAGVESASPKVWNVRFDNVIGTVTADNSLFHHSRENIVGVFNNGSTSLTLNVTNGEFRDTATAAPGSDGLLLNLNGSANVTLSVSGSSFLRNFSTGAEYLGNNNSGGGSFTVANSVFDANAIDINLAHQGLGKTVTFNIHDNMLRQATGGLSNSIAVGLGSSSNATTVLQGKIQNNTIGTDSVANSGSFQGNGVVVTPLGAGTLTALLKNNTVKQVAGNDGFNMQPFQFTGTVNLTLDSNTFSVNNSSANSAYGIDIIAGNDAADTGTICANITNNHANGNPGTVGSGLELLTGAGNPTVLLQGYGGAMNNAAQIIAFLDSTNTVSPSPAVVGTSPGTIKGASSPCTTPPLMFAPGGVESAVRDAFRFDTGILKSQRVLLSTLIGDSNILDQVKLDFIVAAARQRWQLTGISADQMSVLNSMKFKTADLGDSYLGLSGCEYVTLDETAAGHGWFIDPTPLDDEEFRNAVSPTRLYTDPYSAPAGRVDLLTAVMHEMGHRLGRPDTYATEQRSDLMYGELTVGERRLPAKAISNTTKTDETKAFTAGLINSASAAALPTVIEKHDDARTNHHREPRVLPNHAVKSNEKKTESIIAGSPAKRDNTITPFSGEMISFNLPVPLNVGKSVTIKYDATVNTPPGAAFVQTQGNVTFTGGPGGGINTTDPETGTQIPTKTNINTAITWIGVTSTDWNTTTNWDFNYVPLSFSDVKVPNAAQPNQPTLSSSSPTVNSLNLGNTRVLTISGQTLTITGSTASDLTLDGNINGGALSFGAGTHGINNAGGTGSITPTNSTTVLNTANVTLNNNLQMDSLTINSGGTLNITNRTLSLTGSLSNAGTLTLTGSTVIFNGTGAQTLTNTTAFNNLTSNNTGGSVTLGSNATVNGTLTLTSDLTTTNSFTLTMPIAGIISGGADVVGNFTRTNGGPQFPSATNITFGNPNTLLNFTAAGTRPTSINFKLTKTTPTDAATGGTNTGFPGAVARTYVITPTGGSGYAATMQLHYLTGELNGNSEAQPGPGPTVSLRLYKYVINGPGTGWQQQDINNNFANTTVDTTSPGNHFVKLGALGFNGFSPWTIGGVSPTAATSTVSGRVVDDNGNPIEGAVVRLQGTQNRKVITDSQGNYNFFEVETNGFYTVTPSRVNYNFAPATRGFSALGARTEASFGATYNGGHQNPIDTTEYFVRQQYVDFLGREPEEQGFNGWSDTINNCATGDTSCDRVHVSESFFKSNEFQQRGYFVYRFYSTALGRKPDYAEFTPDISRVSGFLTDDQLEAAKNQFANDFTARAAFVNQYGMLNNSQYVDALAQTAAVTLSNRQALIDSLNSGTMTRAQALRQIAESNDVYAKYYNQAFVVMEYFGYLKRDPDILYLNWIDVLNQGGDSRPMVEGFVNSTEYRNRFVAAGNCNNPLDTTEYFVRQQYVDFLRREPEKRSGGRRISRKVSKVSDLQNGAELRTALSLAEQT